MIIATKSMEASAGSFIPDLQNNASYHCMSLFLFYFSKISFIEAKSSTITMKDVSGKTILMLKKEQQLQGYLTTSDKCN